VNFFEAHRFFKGNAPRFGRRDEAEIADEEDPALVNPLLFDALQFALKKR